MKTTTHFLADGGALVYLAEPILKKIFTRFVWGHPFSTYVSHNVLLVSQLMLLILQFVFLVS